MAVASVLVQASDDADPGRRWTLRRCLITWSPYRVCVPLWPVTVTKDVVQIFQPTDVTKAELTSMYMLELGIGQ